MEGIPLDLMQENNKDVVIQKLEKKLFESQEDLKSTQLSLIQRYFIDNLTSLPNVYQLRKDLVENEEMVQVLTKCLHMKVMYSSMEEKVTIHYK